MILNGARGRNRTGTTRRSTDFKSVASTNFATRALGWASGWATYARIIDKLSTQPCGKLRLHSLFPCGRFRLLPLATLVRPAHRSLLDFLSPRHLCVLHIVYQFRHPGRGTFTTECWKNGGASRSRTGLRGFAIQCITALLSRHNLFGSECINPDSGERDCSNPVHSLPFCRAIALGALLSRLHSQYRALGVPLTKNLGCTEVFYNWSGKRDSNSRPQPWQGCALPAELFPRKLLDISLVLTSAGLNRLRLPPARAIY